MIEDEMKNYCDETHQEEYISSPHAFLGFLKPTVIMLLISIIIYWISLAFDFQWLQINSNLHLILLILAVIMGGVSTLYVIGQIALYHGIVDFLYPNRASRNVIGTINPTEEVKNTIIYSAHHDSAYEWNLFFYLKTFGALMILMGLVLTVLIFLIMLVKTTKGGEAA